MIAGVVSEKADIVNAVQVGTRYSVAHRGRIQFDPLHRTAGGSGADDEQIKIDLSKVPSEIKKIIFTVTISNAEQRGQSFGQVSRAFIHVLNESNGKELVRYDLNEKFSNETAVVVAELFRTSNGWNFSATGEGLRGGIENLCRRYGVNV